MSSCSPQLLFLFFSIHRFSPLTHIHTLYIHLSLLAFTFYLFKEKNIYRLFDSPQILSFFFLLHFLHTLPNDWHSWHPLSYLWHLGVVSLLIYISNIILDIVDITRLISRSHRLKYLFCWVTSDQTPYRSWH